MNTHCLKYVFLFTALLAMPATAVLTLTEITSPSFGLILSGASGRQFILNTSDTVTGANAADYVSSAVAGVITATDDTSPATIEILADNISSAGGLTVNEVLCSYGGGAQTRCDGTPLVESSAASTSLRVGVDITTNQIHSGGDNASVNFDITLTYQ